MAKNWIPKLTIQQELLVGKETLNLTAALTAWRGATTCVRHARKGLGQRSEIILRHNKVVEETRVALAHAMAGMAASTISEENAGTTRH